MAKRTCIIDGCDRPHKARGWCGKHYARGLRRGDVSTMERRPNGAGSVSHQGYMVVFDPSHPLAMSCGRVLEHRRVLYGGIGPESHPCHWCGRVVRWGARAEDPAADLVVDHLDEDKLNNALPNLVPSCGTCNMARGRAEDGAQAVSPDGSGTQRPSLWEQQGQPLALPTECVRCFGLLDGVSVDWCVGCLDYLRGGDAA